MRDIENILTATDFSHGSEVAAMIALRAAELYQAKLIAAHVVHNMDESFSFLIEDVEGYEDKVVAEAETSLSELLTSLRVSKTMARSIVTKGSAVEGLIRIALQEHADLVVAGMVGSTKSRKASTLGGVVEQLIMCGLFDLLLVRDDQLGGFKNIAVATDFSEEADMAVRRALDIVGRKKGDMVTLIHAYEWPQGYSKLGLSPEETDAHCRSAAQKRFDDLVTRLPAPSGISYHPVFVRGRAEDAVRDACVHEEIDLLLIGAEGRTSAAVALIGNVALKIIREAPCSIWITRTPGKQLSFIDGVRRLMGLESD